MGAIASQITSLTIVYSTVYSRADQRKKSKLRVTGLLPQMTSNRGRARGPAGFDAPFNMGSTKCEIEWNSNFEVRYLTD